MLYDCNKSDASAAVKVKYTDAELGPFPITGISPATTDDEIERKTWGYSPYSTYWDPQMPCMNYKSIFSKIPSIGVTYQ